MASVLVHEVAEGRNTQSKEFYWRLRFGDDEPPHPINLRDTFPSPKATISKADIQRFSAVVSDDGESCKGVCSVEVHAPMDFAMTTSWQAIMKPIFPADVPLDPPNRSPFEPLQMVTGARPLKAGAVCMSEARRLHDQQQETAMLS
ncbi:hypothetical protein M407DRAFT_29830 [Tulasnella calospora MUT 4182]|uniref:Fatty acid synthase meander beta sheet domain-containing protein n=1 Tax=Tulasnella calospora MUT 4182 TaxID=1051891 RepID=A0A0C3Q9C3_9AGAM|nr:hypothetical protein M407DRAFT_29830 [Tulasnella calospora MUT 4182]